MEKLLQVERERLNRDKRGNVVWFAEKDASLYLKFSATEILYFEISFGQDIYVGGVESSFRYGKINEASRSIDMLPRSSIIDHDEYSQKDWDMSWAIEVIESCEGLEDALQKALREFLLTGNIEKLKTKEPFKTFDVKYLTGN